MKKKKRNNILASISPSLIIFIATILTYFPYFKNSFGIDTSTMIMNQNQMLEGYLTQGRFGIVLFFNLFVHHYDNQMVPFIVVPLLAFSGIYLYFVLKQYDKKSSNLSALLFSMVFVNNPVVYAQLYFKGQALYIVIGLLFVIIGTHLSLSRAKVFVKIVGGSVLFGFSLLIYQVFAFFIFSMILLCLLLFEAKRKVILQSMVPSLLIGSIFYLSAYMIASSVIQYSAYGNETYMMWNKLNTIGGMQRLGVLAIGLFAIAYTALLILTLVRYKSGKNIDGLLLMLLLGSILTFNMAFGNVKPTPRVYFGTFSLVFGGLLYLLAQKGGKLKVLSALLVLISMVFTFSLSYKANRSYENDLTLTQNVVDFAKANQVTQGKEKETNLVFIGNLQIGNQGFINKFQDLFITGATRTSFFQFDPNLTSVRPYDFMKTQGYNFQIPNLSLRTMINEKYKNLPDYSDKQSMILDKPSNTIVVKLSNEGS